MTCTFSEPVTAFHPCSATVCASRLEIKREIIYFTLMQGWKRFSKIVLHSPFQNKKISQISIEMREMTNT